MGSMIGIPNPHGINTPMMTMLPMGSEGAPADPAASNRASRQRAIYRFPPMCMEEPRFQPVDGQILSLNDPG